MKSPIIAFLGHVDAGKTSIMDCIRDTYFAYKEIGGLTQTIGITEVPTSRIEELSKELLEKFKVKVNVESLIFIDSPGHEAFVTLRERGASIADFAILTVDSKEGIQKQTIESINILKAYKTPFLVALTKIDMIDGYIPKKDMSFLEFINSQNPKYTQNLEERLYSLVSDLSNYGFSSERYDRVKDFTKEVAIVPVSSVNNIGVNDLLVLIIGISQRYLPSEPTERADVAIVEEKAIKGLGKVYDAIVYSGKINVGDRVLMETLDGVKETKIKGIMKLKPLEESRENFGRYESVGSIDAVKPIRLILQNPEVLIGTSISVFKDETEKENIEHTMKSSIQNYNDEKSGGVIVCADSIGSLDAMKKLSESEGIQVGLAKIGSPTKRDLDLAKVGNRAIMCFNVKIDREVTELADAEKVVLIQGKAIYSIMDQYKTLLSQQKGRELQDKLSKIILPAKFRVIEKSVFRRSNPCVFGAEILLGEIRPGYRVIKSDGKVLGRIMDIQNENKKLENAKAGDKIAVSIDDAVFGRNLYENDLLYTDIGQNDLINFEDVKDSLPEDYSLALNEIRKIKRF
ncbi:translation initiation factor IF-2 [Candidatus Parvarchaeota archaeon]|uniref:Translation initiation factor IF-2 n=1 Tax=Candidatus Acidifodinimicrobium mancum TaxID=2898728 RepID=A0A8T3UR59_9ARCH|nr:translation initiation factor IF-2 [Candidatus Acidifodinimicrobium mancum]